MMKNPLIAVLSVIAMFLAGFGSALAHGSDHLRLYLRVGEERTILSVTVDADLFLQFDSDQNGEVSVGEFLEQHNLMNAYVNENLMLLNAQNEALSPVLSDLVVQAIEGKPEDHPISRVKIIRYYAVDAKTPAYLACRLFSAEEGELDFVFLTPDGARTGHLTPDQQIVPINIAG